MTLLGYVVACTLQLRKLVSSEIFIANPRAHVKTIDAKQRANAGEASFIIKNIFAGLPPGTMRNFLKFLSASLKYLSSNYGDRWGITLFKDGLRLNVGWVEVIVLKSNALNVLVEKEVAPYGTKTFYDDFETAPGCGLTRVPLAEIPEILPKLLEAHHSAISIAAKRKTTKYIREAHSVGVTHFLSEVLAEPIIHPSYQVNGSTGHDYLVLWKYSEAVSVKGQEVYKAEGRHATSLKKGDRMFVAATNMDELYLLGAIEVQQTGKTSSSGRCLFGAFQILPLNSLKWKLRFISLNSPRLSTEYKLARQVRSRRELTPDSARLLEDLLTKTETRRREEFVAQEGSIKEFTLLKREREPKVRQNALVERGMVCEICGFDFAATYGEFAATCVEVHHIKSLAKAAKNGTKTSVQDVIVACPNCHRALHRYKSPEDWKGFKAFCGFR
jgi:hypothetical protein